MPSSASCASPLSAVASAPQAADVLLSREVPKSSAPIRELARRVQTYGLYALLFFLPISKAAIELLFPVLLAGWLLEHARDGWRQSVWRAPGGRACRLALLLFLGACALSTIGSTNPALSWRGFSCKTLEYALLFVIAADLGDRSVVLRRGLTVLLVSAAVVCLDAIIQELAGVDPLRGHHLSGYCRMTGPYENPTDLATFFMVVAPVAIFRAITPGQRHRWLMRGLALMILACMVRTGSEGAWLGEVVGMGSVIVMMRHRWRRDVLIVSIGVLVLGGAWALGGSWLLSRTRVIDALHALQIAGVGYRDRVFMWKAALGMVLDRPLLGQGLNTFMSHYLDFWVGGEQQPRYAHNCFLQVAAETGIVGLTTFVWLLGAMLVAWWRGVQRSAESSDARTIVLGLSAGLIAFIVQSAFDTNFYAMRQAVLFWTLAGLAMSAGLHPREHAD